ncbi:hypothetical protein OH492_19025 [Vibrio chagasii]|nr:hypothetical protein [Vibrio chagasii]
MATRSHDISQAGRQIDYEKNILDYYDADGSKIQGATSIPGGFTSSMKSISSQQRMLMISAFVIDQITTQYYDGTRGPAFDNGLLKPLQIVQGISDLMSITRSGTINKSIRTLIYRRIAWPCSRHRLYVMSSKPKISPKAVGYPTERISMKMMATSSLLFLPRRRCQNQR